jgi:hypothetical protein
MNWAQGNPSVGLYRYNGPHSRGDKVQNNGNLNGLYRMGRHHQGVTWGVRFSTNPTGSFGWDQIAFLGCPTMVTADHAVMFEPHGKQSGAPYYQQDAQVLSNYHYDRNYLYGDLHAEYSHATSRAGLP